MPEDSQMSQKSLEEHLEGLVGAMSEIEQLLEINNSSLSRLAPSSKGEGCEETKTSSGDPGVPPFLVRLSSARERLNDIRSQLAMQVDHLCEAI